MARKVTDRHIPLSMYYEAYYEFRKHCRDSESQQVFEASYAYNLFCIRRDVVERHIDLGTSYAFIVKKPQPREVFAGSIYKRVLDRLCVMILKPYMDGKFSDRQYNVREGFGLLQYQQRLHRDMKEAKEEKAAAEPQHTEQKHDERIDGGRINGGRMDGGQMDDGQMDAGQKHDGHREPWVLGGDIKSYFMSMDKDVVWKKWEAVIRDWYGGEYMDELLYIMMKIVYYEPEKSCIRLSKTEDWELIPLHKSLFTNGDGKGMPIGDLVSQYTALLLLRDFCFFLEGYVSRVGIYMDDWYAIGDHDVLLAMLPLARKELKKAGLRLNENKTYFQPVRHGLKTCGNVAFPDRAYVSNRVVDNAMQTVLYYNDHIRGDVVRFCQRMNSYLGVFLHFKTYSVRWRLAHAIPPEWWRKVGMAGHYEKFVVRHKDMLKDRKT